ncbi:MAG: PEP/pyruvate-binding domain-containing protein [Myxococcota bacterium]
MARLRRVETIVPRRTEGYGGKAKNLAALARAGFPVPPAYALPGSAAEEFYQRALPEIDRLEALFSSDAHIDPKRLASIAERVRMATLPPSLLEPLQEAYRELSDDGAVGIAVRSSSTFEDLEGASAAGMHSTFLNVRSEEALLDAVRACWASLFAPQVATYLRQMRIVPRAPIGLVLQRMIDAQTSGVLFTVNPLTGDPGEMVVNANYGLGCAVVDGRVSPDTLRIDKASRELRDRVMGDKSFRTVLADEGGVRDEEVPDEERHRACLSELAVEELTQLGLRIEDHFDDPRDVEWARSGDQLFVLQARPVTTVSKVTTRMWSRRKRHDGERSKIVWSNVNVGEALPGVATPLTWSVASGFSDLGFRRAFGSLGCTVPRDAELVGNFRGRIYLNLTEFMGILSQVPGLRPRMLLELGGGGEEERLEQEVERRSPVRFLMRLPMTAARFAKENYRITDRAEAFERLFADEYVRLDGLDLRLLAPSSLGKTLSDVEGMLDEAGAIMLTCYGNLLSSVVLLRTVLKLVAGDRAEGLQRDLLTGLADVDSAAPGLALWHIAEMARTDRPAREMIRDRPSSELSLGQLPQGPTRRALQRFVEAYGHRGAREAEIAEPRWREDASLLFATLQIHLRREGARERPIDVERRQRAIRSQAEAELERLLPGAARAAVRHLLALVQRFARLRERLRDNVVKVLGQFRRVALDASRRIEQREPEAGSDAAFFLTLEELHAMLRGELRTVTAIVGQRRRQYLRDRSLADPPDTFVGFPPPVPAPAPDVRTLHGLGASSGQAEGRARVVTSASGADALQAGEILVASVADVGWSPLFLVAGAVVTDLGGPLSHAAIVLREYGVPAVVNVKVGTRAIRTGDRLLVDGDAGEVRVLEGPDD